MLLSEVSLSLSMPDNFHMYGVCCGKLTVLSNDSWEERLSNDETDVLVKNRRE